MTRLPNTFPLDVLIVCVANFIKNITVKFCNSPLNHPSKNFLLAENFFESEPSGL